MIVTRNGLPREDLLRRATFLELLRYQFDDLTEREEHLVLFRKEHLSFSRIARELKCSRGNACKQWRSLLRRHPTLPSFL